MDAPKKKTSPIKKPPSISPFLKGRGPTTIYERALRGIAREVGKLIDGYQPTDPVSSASLTQALKGYSELIGPWALHLATNLFGQVDRQDKMAWQEHSKTMSESLRKEIANTDTGSVLQALLRANVLLIKSIPIQAAERVHNLVQENMMVGLRSSELAKKIMETEGVTKSRATLIARTEVSKASTALTQARALAIESDGYLWQTVGDLVVRPSHKAMNGKFVRWDSPVTLDNMTGHAGGFPNCRCWPLPQVPEGKWE